MNAITTLRLGRQIDNRVEIPKENEHQDPISKFNSAPEKLTLDSLAPKPIPIPPSPPFVEKDNEKPFENVIEITFVLKAPFPERLRNNKKHTHMEKI